MTREEALTRLNAGGYPPQSVVRKEGRFEVCIPAHPGDTDLTFLSIYDDGHFETHGSVAGEVENLLRMPSSLRNLLVSEEDRAESTQVSTQLAIFCVYGHDLIAKVELEAILRRWGLEPLFLDQLPSAGMTFIEKLEQFWDRAQFAVVLATPDDEGFPAGALALPRAGGACRRAAHRVRRALPE